MEFYDITNNEYFALLDNPIKDTRIKVEILDHFENCLDSIERSIDSSLSGNIVSNNEQGTRKTCSFTLINVDEKYNLNENNFFWFNRKFKLYKGISDGKDTFWFTKGVFITQQADLDSTNKTVSIQGVDKYAQLDGTLNVLQADQMDTVFEIGTTVDTVIRDILLLDLGNGIVLDPIEPIIDPDIGRQKLYKEYTMSAGSYYGDFLSEVMSSFGCDIFYDNFGRLKVQRVFNDDISYWYAFKSSVYNFDYDKVDYISPSLSGQLNGVNKITVQTDNTETENASYTAYNNNPRSPLCCEKIGARTYKENGGIVYITAGDETIDTPESKCKEYAEYMLIKETCLDLSIDFNTSSIPHLNEGDIITITDKQFGLDVDGFMIQSITEPLGVGEMSISAVNLKYLPTDISNSSSASDLINMGRLYNISVDYSLNGGSGTTPETQNINYFESFSPEIVSNTCEVYTKPGYEFIGWDENGLSKTPKYTSADETYSAPNKDTTLNACWDSTDGCQFEIIVDDVSKLGTGNVYFDRIAAESPEYIIINGEKTYINQLNPTSTSYPTMKSISGISGELDYIHGVSKHNYQSIDTTEMFYEIFAKFLYYTDVDGINVTVHFPEKLPNETVLLKPVSNNCTITTLILPKHNLLFKSTDYYGYFLYHTSGITTFEFDYDLGFENIRALTYCNDLGKVNLKKSLKVDSINSQGAFVYNCNNLATVDLKDTSIEGGECIYGCPKLQTINIAGDVNLLATTTTSNNYTNYTSVYLGCYCSLLNSFTVSGNLTAKGLTSNTRAYLCDGCGGLKNITVTGNFNGEYMNAVNYNSGTLDSLDVQGAINFCTCNIATSSNKVQLLKSGGNMLLTNGAYVYSEQTNVANDLTIKNGSSLYASNLSCDTLTLIDGGGLFLASYGNNGTITVTGDTTISNSSSTPMYLSKFETNDLTVKNVSFPAQYSVIDDLTIKGEFYADNSSIFNNRTTLGKFHVIGDTTITYQFMCGNYTTFTENSSLIFGGDFTLDSASAMCGVTLNTPIKFNGLVSAVGSGSNFLSSATINSETPLEFSGGVDFPQGNNILLMGSTFNINKTVEFYQDTILGTAAITSNAGLEVINFHGAAQITNAINSNAELKQVYFFDTATIDNSLLSNANLTAIYFHGAVNIGNNTINGNNSLVDVYFYDDNVVIAEGSTVFSSNNSELTLHGISGGNVKSIAQQYNLKFSAINGGE